jgi:hypothetical protein
MKKIIFCFKTLILIVFLSKVTACNISAGSYANAEVYEMDVDESTLIEAIQSFKKDNPQYKVPEQIQLKDGRSDNKDHWYHIYFYYPEENQIIYAWTRPAGKEKTTFALVSINQGLTLGNWKEINRDFSSSENRDQKKKFEERILNMIKKKL